MKPPSASTNIASLYVYINVYQVLTLSLLYPTEGDPPISLVFGSFVRTRCVILPRARDWIARIRSLSGTSVSVFTSCNHHQVLTLYPPRVHISCILQSINPLPEYWPLKDKKDRHIRQSAKESNQNDNILVTKCT